MHSELATPSTLRAGRRSRGAGASAAVKQDLTVTKFVDKSSNVLITTSRLRLYGSRPRRTGVRLRPLGESLTRTLTYPRREPPTPAFWPRRSSIRFVAWTAAPTLRLPAPLSRSLSASATKCLLTRAARSGERASVDQGGATRLRQPCVNHKRGCHDVTQ